MTSVLLQHFVPIICFVPWASQKLLNKYKELKTWQCWNGYICGKHQQKRVCESISKHVEEPSSVREENGEENEKTTVLNLLLLKIFNPSERSV